MKTLSPTSERGKWYLERYYESSDTELSDVYQRHSLFKSRAFKECIKMYLDENGKRFRIISHNNMQYTVGWIVYGEEEDWLHIHTKLNDYSIGLGMLPF